MAKPIIKMMSNMESLGDMVGTLAGVADGLDQPRYMESLIKDAHSRTSDIFDYAAAGAAATGRLSHVYEFGTAGVTKGPIRFPDPTSAAARLYEHTLTGTGGNQNIGYRFRPAVVPNPQPTTKDTGVAARYLKKLSGNKYVFWNKAFVMETGAPVTIRSKSPHGLLFVPFNGAPSHDPRNTRGYMMWNTNTKGDRTVIPGKTTKGNFTAFWMGWWTAEGSGNMASMIREDIVRDTRLAIHRAQGQGRHRMRTPATTNIHKASKKARTRTKTMFGRRR